MVPRLSRKRCNPNAGFSQESRSALFRRLEHDGRDYRLVALNGKYDPVPVPGDDCCEGLLVGLVRRSGLELTTRLNPDGLA